MRRIIVDYSKLTNEILNLLVERFPDGYDDSNIIRFRNAQNELVEAVEVRTEDTIYLVKVSTKLASRLENFEDEDDDIVDDVVAPIDNIKGMDIDDEDAIDDDEEEVDVTKDPGGSDEDDEDDEDEDDFDSDNNEEDDEDDEDDR
ncbi:DNA primase [Flavobacterium sp.]|uniref:DNA primase n=1 Tax=Flavobacterium sp. TaxID=239 RepID=UPI0039E3D621